MSVLPDSSEHLLNVTVVGAGAFGTAIAEVAARNGNKVKLLARKQEVVDSINNNHTNPHYLSEFKLSDNVSACLSVDEALDGCELLILAIPTQQVRTSALFFLSLYSLLISKLGASMVGKPKRKALS
jgi:glycerol-3-phosphate dehydrogenase